MSNTVGLQLRQARQERGLTFEEVAQATKIRTHYLQLMEAGEFTALPSKAQARGFLRSYAEYLELDVASLLEGMEPGTSHNVTNPPSVKKPTLADEQGSDQLVQNEVAKTVRIRDIKDNGARQVIADDQMYFQDIGRSLQSQRELLGLTFEEVEHYTRLRKHYLQSLEAGNLNELPSSVQARGMLNNYAVFLGLDPEPLLLNFAEGLQNQLASRRATEQPTRSQKSRRKSERKYFSLPLDLMIGAIIGIAMVGFVIWGGLRILSASSQNQGMDPTAPSIAEVLLASPTASSSPTALPSSPLPPPTLTLPAGAIVTDAVSGEIRTSVEQGQVMLQLIIQQRTWLRVIVDGKIEFEGRAITGSAQSFVGENSIEILAGNGEALRVIYNQQDLGLLGDYGEVVNVIFTNEGVIEPTPTITLTPSATSPIPVVPSPTLSQPSLPGIATPGPGTPELP